MNAPQIRLQAGTLVNVDGVLHKVLSRDTEGVNLRTLGECPVTVRKTHEEIADLYFGTPRRFKLVEQVAEGLPVGIRDNLLREIESFDVRRQDAALRRLDYVQACDAAFRSGTHKKVITGYAAIAREVALQRRLQAAEADGLEPEQVGMEKVSGSSLKGWYSRWRKSGRKLAGLIPLDDLKGRPGFRLDPEVEIVIARRIREDWLLLEGPPLSHVILFIQSDVTRINEGRVVPLAIPDAMTVRRWVDVNVSLFDQVYHRKGPAEAEQQFRHVRTAPQTTQPLEIVEIDHTPIDVLLVASDGDLARETRRKDKRTKRAWLTIAICATTRMIVGFHISEERPSWTSVMNCLRMAVLPKDLEGVEVRTSWPVFGVPQVVKLDNGREFHSRSMKAAAGQLRIELRYMPRGKPHMKGKVERVLGTVARDFCAYLPGRTFRDVRERGDYDSVGRAAYTLPKLIELFTVWVVDIYHNRPHGGLLGRTPLQRWQDLAGMGVRLPPSADDLSPLISLVVPRTIRRDGITFLGLRYQSEILRGVRRRKGFHFGEEFLVKVDPADIGEILVLVNEREGWQAVPAEDPGLADGVTLHEWRETVRLARKMTSEGQRVAHKTLVEAMNLLRDEGRNAGARPSKMTQFDVDWFRERLDDPWFDVAADPSDDGAHVKERRRRRKLEAADGKPRKPGRPAAEDDGEFMTAEPNVVPTPPETTATILEDEEEWTAE